MKSMPICLCMKFMPMLLFLGPAIRKKLCRQSKGSFMSHNKIIKGNVPLSLT